MTYRCGGCGWRGARPKQPRGTDVDICPDCASLVHEADAEDDGDDGDDDWEWNPTILAGPDGEELEPGCCDDYRNDDSGAP